jgi:hypothetical protein
VTTAGTFLRRIVGLLEAANVPYMLTGSFASTFHGTPRATQDVDLVVAPSPGGLRCSACNATGSTWSMWSSGLRSSASPSSGAGSVAAEWPLTYEALDLARVVEREDALAGDRRFRDQRTAPVLGSMPRTEAESVTTTTAPAEA